MRNGHTVAIALRWRRGSSQRELLAVGLLADRVRAAVAGGGPGGRFVSPMAQRAGYYSFPARSEGDCDPPEGVCDPREGGLRPLGGGLPPNRAGLLPATVRPPRNVGPEGLGGARGARCGGGGGSRARAAGARQGARGRVTGLRPFRSLRDLRRGPGAVYVIGGRLYVNRIAYRLTPRRDGRLDRAATGRTSAAASAATPGRVGP